MNKSFIPVTLLAFLISHSSAIALQTKVVSNSKYPIYVTVFEGSCKANQSTLEKVVEGLRKEGAVSKIKGAIVATLQGEGCKNAEKTIVLKNNESIEVSEGEIIVAFKDPVAAYNDHKKIVNPTPAVCHVTGGHSIYLVTRKSEGLRSFFGIAGDGGLKCQTK